MHKSNSTYFTDVDIARTHLLCTLFAKGIEKVRGGTGSVVKGKVSNFAVALGAVSCSFRRELKPYEKYDIYTRVLSWDEKWLYVVTHFVKKGAAVPSNVTLYPRQNRSFNFSKKGSHYDQEPKKAVVASALSKLVFKKGRITIAPEIMLEASGLLPEKVTEVQVINDRDAMNTPSEAAFPKDERIALPTKISAQVDENDGQRSSRANSVGSNAGWEDGRSVAESLTTPEDTDDDSADPLSKKPQSSGWTRERIERERRRGMELAKLLGQQAELANECRLNSDALGAHSDGCGITGVCSTLAQLGRLTRKSTL